MRGRLAARLIIVIVLDVLVGVVNAQEAVPAARALQGRWVVTGGEHDGAPMDSIKGGVLTVTGNGFEIRTASGNMLKGTLRINTSTSPFQIDFLHADGAVWEAIYEISGDGLRLNYIEKGGTDPRPSAFTTSDKTEASIVTLRRESAER